MKIAVLGTGMVGRAIAARLDELGHDVTVGTRDPGATQGDNPAFAEWQAQHAAVSLASFRDAAGSADLVVNATSGTVSMSVLQAAGADHLAGKILIDISNPLDFSAGMPPSLFVKDTDSLGEQIQRAFPEARVVKTLNTLTADLMVRPASLGAESTVFVAGDDEVARKEVTHLLESFGHTDVMDLGDITAARGLEMVLPIWLRLYGALGSPTFNVKVVRQA